MEPQIVRKDWKYHLKSAVWTFAVIFIPILALEVKDLSMDSVEMAFTVSGFVAALRAFGRIILEPVFAALWKAIVAFLHSVSEKIKGLKK